tara:strand:- start:4395 stop:5555 length:1161 start_codon:yes stop_codon:yes gene_type:complete
MKNVLFLSFDGILEPLGYSQVLSYLVQLSKGRNISILSIEKENDLNNYNHFQKILNITKENNINWQYVKYKKGKLKYFIVIYFFVKTIKIYYVNKINIIHARSYISGLLSYFLKFIFNFNFIFDIRGFWIEERVEWKLWDSKSFKYLFFKFFEKKIYNKSDIIVVLTNDAEQIIKKKILKKDTDKIYVIPTSIKILKHNFNKKIKNKEPIFTHLGSIGTRYDFLKYLKVLNIINDKFKIKLQIINKGEHDKIKQIIKSNNFENLDYHIEYIEPYKVLDQIKNSDFGIFFPINGFYLNGYFPTKLGEFLSLGIPVITTSINNHVNEIILSNNVGIIIDNINPNYNIILNNIKNLIDDDQLEARCRNVAKQHFDMNKAIKKYSTIYGN